MLHVITVATGSAGERGLHDASVRRILEVLDGELRRLSDAAGEGWLSADDLDDVEGVRRRVAQLVIAVGEG